MTYRVFSARWWADKRNTVPITMPRRTRTICVVGTEDEARELCRQFNTDNHGNRVKRPYGVAYEYERV